MKVKAINELSMDIILSIGSSIIIMIPIYFPKEILNYFFQSVILNIIKLKNFRL